MQSWQTLAQVEKKHILHTLHACLYNYTKAASALGIPRSTLYRKAGTYAELTQLKTKRDEIGMGDLFK